MLQAAFAVGSDELPRPFLDLLEQLGDPEPAAPIELDDAAFRALLVELIPRLRAFARSLARDDAFADDLVQTAMLRAWKARRRFLPGSNFKAWMFTILRNGFLSDLRKHRHTVEWDESLMAGKLVTPADQDRRLHVADVEAALLKLPVTQRQVLMLVGAEQLTYEETAGICGVPVGTIKSRVARGRAALSRLMDGALLEAA